MCHVDFPGDRVSRRMRVGIWFRGDAEIMHQLDLVGADRLLGVLLDYRASLVRDRARWRVLDAHDQYPLSSSRAFARRMSAFAAFGFWR